MKRTLSKSHSEMADESFEVHVHSCVAQEWIQLLIRRGIKGQNFFERNQLTKNTLIFFPIIWEGPGIVPPKPVPTFLLRLLLFLRFISWLSFNIKRIKSFFY
jgi:hypothetical protein